MRILAIREVDVAVVVAPSQLPREQKVEALKRIPVPMPLVVTVVDAK